MKIEPPSSSSKDNIELLLKPVVNIEELDESRIEFDIEDFIKFSIVEDQVVYNAFKKIDPNHKEDRAKIREARKKKSNKKLNKTKKKAFLKKKPKEEKKKPPEK